MKKREFRYDPFLVWTWSAVGIAFALSLPFLDTALSFNMRELLLDRDYGRLATGIIAVCFGMEILFLRLRKGKALKWVPVVFPVICLVAAEVFWLMGGWEQIAGVIFWWFGFPMLMGAALGVLVTHFPQNGKMRTVLVIVLVLAVVFCALFWPRPLAEHLRLDIEESMLVLYPDGTSEWKTLRNTNTVEQMLHYAEVIPAFSAPEWRNEDCILIRLNAEYIAAVEYGENASIYFYSGKLEEFDGSGVKWRLFYFPALYTELIGGAELTAETSE